jgi:hypothetical protein
MGFSPACLAHPTPTERSSTTAPLPGRRPVGTDQVWIRTRLPRGSITPWAPDGVASSGSGWCPRSRRGGPLPRAGPIFGGVERRIAACREVGVQPRLGSRSWTCRKLVALTCGFAAGERRSCALIPGLRAGVPYLRTGLDGVGPAGKSVSQRAAGSAR